MKFTIEVDEFYLDGENDLEPALKQFIISQVVNSINKSIKSKVEEGIDKEVKSQVEQSLYRKIGKLVEETIASDKIKGRYSNSPEVTLQEYIKAQFTETAQQKAPTDEIIRKLAIQFGDEMKKRYDLLFASQLVAKMNESGFIKEEAIKLLLNQH